MYVVRTGCAVAEPEQLVQLRGIHLRYTWWCWCTMISPLSLLWQPSHLPSFHHETILSPSFSQFSLLQTLKCLFYKRKKKTTTTTTVQTDVMCTDEERAREMWSYSESIMMPHLEVEIERERERVCAPAFVIVLMRFQDWDQSAFLCVCPFEHS